MPDSVLVRFKPYNREIRVARGETLLQAAMQAGVYIQASCGGEGVCGKCLVQIDKGEVEGSRDPKISPQDFERGVRQACKTRILSDLEVTVPTEAALDKKVPVLPGGFQGFRTGNGHDPRRREDKTQSRSRILNHPA